MSIWLPAAVPDPLVPGGPPRPAPRTLFVDRDGVIIEDRHYLADPDGVVLLPRAAAALRDARAAGFRLVGVSNQSGIGRGLYDEAAFAAVQARVDELLAAAAACLDVLVYCPHAPEAGCRCRKPGPGLLEEARELLIWEPARSWLVGDKLTDLELARRARLRGLLVLTGEGAAARRSPEAKGATVVADLAAAVRLILGSGDGPDLRPTAGRSPETT
jgi:D-glycero-D-manno-heptose 1,7-bisphosphate phosphatase